MTENDRGKSSINVYDYNTGAVLGNAEAEEISAEDTPIPVSGEDLTRESTAVDKADPAKQMLDTDIFHLIQNTDTITRTLMDTDTGRVKDKSDVTEETPVVSDDTLSAATEAIAVTADDDHSSDDEVIEESMPDGDIGRDDSKDTESADFLLDEAGTANDIKSQKLTFQDLEAVDMQETAALHQQETLPPLDELEHLDEEELLRELDSLERDYPANDDDDSETTGEETKPGTVRRAAREYEEGEQKEQKITEKNIRDELSRRERESIEDDIMSANSLVIQERVQDIQKKLVQVWKYNRPRQSQIFPQHSEPQEKPRYYSTQSPARIQHAPDIKRIPSPGFTPEQKKSIEEDIAAESSVIIEENVSDLHNHLMKLWQSYTSQFQDISDEVIVFDDEKDVKRFLSQFETKQQQEDMRKLLSYFNDMFQELPEDILARFASSGYYTVFNKLLRQLETGDDEKAGK